jgi:Kef-type K+ transport system membrane component KefB
LGVIFLLFRVGLDVDAVALWKVKGTAMLVAVLGVITPLAAACGLLLVVGSNMAEAVFVGAAMVATSVAITARTLSARGALEERASRIILAAAVIDDVLGLIVLAAVAAFVKGGVSLWDVGLTGAMAGIFTAILAKWGTRLFGKAAPVLDARLRSPESQFNLAVVVLFALAVVASWTGVAAIVGAFLAGLAMSETATQRVRDLSSGVTELFAPFFLAGIGIHIDWSVLRNRETLLFVVALSVLAVLTKLVGCGTAALPLGMRDALKVGLGMVPRGEVGMVVAQFGLGAGVLSARMYGAVVFMAVITTLVTPMLLKMAYGNPPAPAEEAPAGEPEAA